MTSILLTTDGTYPCYRGGVSVWCDQIIRTLPEHEFHVFAVTYSPSNAAVFERPENVRTQTILPLWGTAEPGPAPGRFLDTLIRRLQTTPERIEREFVPQFAELLHCIVQQEQPERFAQALFALHRYFLDCDYAVSVSSPQAWETFLRVSRDRGDPFTLEEATQCMRWLQRYLAVAAVRLPQTHIVHASMAGLAGVPGVLQKMSCGSGFLLTEHGIYLRELYLSLARLRASMPSRRFLFRWFEAIVRMNYRYADTVTSLCEFNRRWQIRMGAAPESIRIVPNGADPTQFYPVAEKPQRPPTVLTMARVYQLKGIDHLLPAIRLVLDQAPEVRWRILGEVGNRDYYAMCRRMADDLGIGENIEWGQTSDAPSAYRSADVFCLPSISEAMPYSVLEAMLSGCPVVATDVGGVAEMLQGTGLLVPPRNPRVLSRALLSLLAGEGAGAYRADLAARALQRARSSYEVQRCSQLFRETYDQLTTTTRTATMPPVR